MIQGGGSELQRMPNVRSQKEEEGGPAARAQREQPTWGVGEGGKP